MFCAYLRGNWPRYNGSALYYPSAMVWDSDKFRCCWHTINCGLISQCIRHGKYRTHDDVIKWKHFPRNWPFVRGIHRSTVNSPHKGQWRGAFMFPLICVWINGWVNNREAGDLIRYRAHYYVIVMGVKNLSDLELRNSPISFPFIGCPYTETRVLKSCQLYHHWRDRSLT